MTTKNRILATLLVAVGLFIATTANAFAAHSPWHRGACAAANNTVAGGVEDLAVRGNANVTAQFMGYKLVNGGGAWQLRHGLVMAISASTVTASNTGCSGGRHFPAHARVIGLGERAAINRPKNISPRAVCAPYARGCKRITVWVTRLLPASCWNGDIVVRSPFWIWIKVHKKTPVKAKPKPKPKPAPTPPAPKVLCVLNGMTYYVGSPPPGYVSTDSSGNCVTQTQIAQQTCADIAKQLGSGATSSYDTATGMCTVTQANCSNVVNIQVNGSGNTIIINQGGNCNNNSPPPPPSSPPPAPSPSASIANLTSIQEVYTNEVRKNVCVDVNIANLPSGKTATAKFTAGTGSFSDGTFDNLGNGVVHLCATYTAPSETGTDTITVSVYLPGVSNPVTAHEQVKVEQTPTGGRS